jgi:hypothetical protein
LEDVHIFLEEDLHNFELHEHAVCLGLVVHGEGYITRGAKVCPTLLWIQKGEKGLSSSLTWILKNKVVSNRVLGLQKDDG